MAEAEVGDDVLGEDPTVNALKRRTAELLGKEAALFVPSGTMANQIAVGVHAGPGDEFLCDATVARLRLGRGRDRPALGRHGPAVHGRPRPARRSTTSRDKIRPDDGHYVRTRLVCLENTHNRGGGRVQPIGQVAAISAWARGQGLAMHLDGARLFNAVVASGVPAAEWARHFDTVSVCFSKGLGAPVGSALAGPADADPRAHRLRKVFGGGMRQAGHDRRRRPCTPWNTTSIASPTTTATPRSSPTPSRSPTASGSNRARSRRTSSGSTSTPRSGPPPRSPPGSNRGGARLGPRPAGPPGLHAPGRRRGTTWPSSPPERIGLRGGRLSVAG